MGKRRKNPNHWVYFLINEGKIVYVGCTSNLVQRMRRHKNKPHNAVRVIHFKSKYIALYYERRWIKFLQPKFNIQKLYYGYNEIQSLKRRNLFRKSVIANFMITKKSPISL